MAEQHFHFESGPVIKILAGISIAAVAAFAVFAFVTGSGLAIALLAVLATVTVVGIILERVDSSPQRKPGSEGTRHQHWGFHGRPGA